MPRRTTVEGGEGEGIPLDELGAGVTGILTQVSPGAASRVGDPVLSSGLRKFAIFPKTRTTLDGGMSGSVWASYRARKLRPGERVVIEG